MIIEPFGHCAIESFAAIAQCLNVSIALLHFFVRRMLAAPTAELLQLQPVRRRFAVLGRRIIPLFAIAALQRNNLSGHRSLQTSSWLLALSSLHFNHSAFPDG
jgi:hypothetical protein